MCQFTQYRRPTPITMLANPATRSARSPSDETWSNARLKLPGLRKGQIPSITKRRAVATRRSRTRVPSQPRGCTPGLRTGWATGRGVKGAKSPKPSVVCPTHGQGNGFDRAPGNTGSSGKPSPRTGWRRAQAKPFCRVTRYSPARLSFGPAGVIGQPNLVAGEGSAMMSPNQTGRIPFAPRRASRAEP